MLHPSPLLVIWLQPNAPQTHVFESGPGKLFDLEVVSALQGKPNPTESLMHMEGTAWHSDTNDSLYYFVGLTSSLDSSFWIDCRRI